MIGIIIGIIIVVAVVILLWAVGTYNRFINLVNGIESTLKQINVALKKRLDLITQVVDSLKGQMKFEKGTLTEITKLRSQATAGMSAEKAKSIETKSLELLGAIQVQIEAYPNLKSNENTTQLINTVNTTEDEIARLRYTYNNSVQEFNTKRQVVPSNIIANMFGFNKQEYLAFEESDSELKKAPKISLE